MQYFSDKVVQINGKYYTSCEKLANVENDDKIVMVREIVKTSKTYEHPVTGKYELKKFDMLRGARKTYIPETEWEGLPDVNEENLRVQLGSFK